MFLNHPSWRGKSREKTPPRRKLRDNCTSVTFDIWWGFTFYQYPKNIAGGSNICL